MSVTVYGASDDLIEVEGDVEEEYNVYDGVKRLTFSDGTVLSIEYAGKGVWRIEPVLPGNASLNIVKAPEDDEDNYSDRATLDGDIRWVRIDR